MATRNLARTVVEGGRSRYSTLYRQQRNRSERRLRFGEEGEIIQGRTRRTEGRDFSDRLSPLERWLQSHVGRGWNNVYREFCERYDRRTLKGWHLNDHLLDMVGLGRFPWSWRYRVDERGILRAEGRRRERRVLPSHCERQRVAAWAAGRKVIVHGTAAFWTARKIDGKEILVAAQGRRLTACERQVWDALAPEWQRELSYQAVIATGLRQPMRPPRASRAPVDPPRAPR
jgi:hypothetical protein